MRRDWTQEISPPSFVVLTLNMLNRAVVPERPLRRTLPHLYNPEHVPGAPHCSMAIKSSGKISSDEISLSWQGASGWRFLPPGNRRERTA